MDSKFRQKVPFSLQMVVLLAVVVLSPWTVDAVRAQPGAPGGVLPDVGARPLPVAKSVRVQKVVAIITRGPSTAKADPELAKAFEAEFERVCATLKGQLAAGPSSPWGLSPFGGVRCQGEPAAEGFAEPSTLVFRIEAVLGGKAVLFAATQVGAGPEALAEAEAGNPLKAKPAARASVRATRAALTKLRLRKFSRLVAAQLVDGLPFLARIESDAHPALRAADAVGEGDGTLPLGASRAGGAAAPSPAAAAAPAPESMAAAGLTSAEGVYALPPGPREFEFIQVTFDPPTRRLKQARVAPARAKALWSKAAVWVKDKGGRGRNRLELARRIAEASKVVDPTEEAEEEALPQEEGAFDAGWSFRGMFTASGLRELNLSSGGYAARGALRLGLGGPYPGYPYALASYARSEIFLVTEGDSKGQKVSVTLSRTRFGGGWRGEFPFSGEALVFAIGPYAAMEKGTLTSKGISGLGGSLADDTAATLYGGEASLDLQSSHVGVSFSGGVERSLKSSGGYSSWSLGASAQYFLARHETWGRPWRHAVQLMVGYDSFRFDLAPEAGERVFDVALSVSQPGMGLGYALTW